MAALSATTRKVIAACFPPKQQTEAARLLGEECGSNLPFLENFDEVQLERVRFAVIKLSGGNLDKLRQATQIAQQDWRDVLVAAGFGHSLTEHQRWAEQLLST
jgi:hypothetical protein